MTDNFTRMDAWYQQQLGSWVKDRECVEVARVLKDLHGDYLLQIGGTADLSHSTASKVAYRYGLFEEPINLESMVQGDWHDLPLQPNSIDVILLVHNLERIRHPVKLLKEVYQSLAPGGHVLILGFNPWSGFGVKRLLNWRGSWPWQGRFWSRAQVKRWLISLDFEILLSKSFGFRLLPGVFSRRAVLFMEATGQLCMPTMGSVYLVAAQKRVYEPLKQREGWLKKRTLIRGVIEPTTRV